MAASSKREDAPLRIALIFDKYRPDTTGGYFERACHALGISADHWWLREIEQIPAGYDLYLRIDCGDAYELTLPTRLRPSVFYAIDTHLPHSWEKIRRMASQFDLVFCCHRDGALRLPGAVWLPVAGDPAVCANREGPKRYDVAFIGTDGGRPRKFYLQALRERYPQSFIGKADYRDLTTIYGQVRIGFNYSIGNDVNMRIFEILTAQTLLVTNALANDDLSRLGFEDRRHLVLYRHPAEVFELIDYYLAHQEAREQIAEAGAEVVRQRHTYVHRMRQLLITVSHRLGVTLPSHLKELNPQCVSS